MALSSCAGSGQITNARVCLEIPFRDGPEGACVWSQSHKTELVDKEKWKLQRPAMLMIDAKSWTDIKTDWLRACRVAGPDCNLTVQSVDNVIRAIDSLAKKLIPLPK